MLTRLKYYKGPYRNGINEEVEDMIWICATTTRQMDDIWLQGVRKITTPLIDNVWNVVSEYIIDRLEDEV